MSVLVQTPLTDMLGIKHPVLLAGMNAVSGPNLAAAVSNCGGLGVVGGVGYTPTMLRKVLTELKEKLATPDTKFGVDLLLPQVGGSARKTNVDYTDGKLPELIDIIIEFKAALFVSAVGVPPKWAVDKLHAAGIVVMNMIGSVKHVKKCLDAGVDLICAQGTEGGGHTGAVATSVLIPQVVDLCRSAKAPINGGPVHVVAAGGIFDGRGLAMALALGASGVWVGTRFICSEEASAPKRHQEAVLSATSEETIRTTIYTGRPMRILKVPYVEEFEEFKRDKIREAQKTGVIAAPKELKEMFEKTGEAPPVEARRPLLMGQAIGAVNKIEPAKKIVESMVAEAAEILQKNAKLVAKL